VLVIYFTSHFVLQLRAYYKATNLHEGLQLGFAKRLQSDTFAGGRWSSGFQRAWIADCRA